MTTTPSPHPLAEGKDTEYNKIRQLNVCFVAEFYCFVWNCNGSLSSVWIKLRQWVRKSHFSLILHSSPGRNCLIHNILTVTNYNEMHTADFKEQRSCVKTCQWMLKEIWGKKKCKVTKFSVARRSIFLLLINSPIRTETLACPKSRMNKS